MTESPHIRELFDITGQVALVTGGARNLGFDMALALAEAGADLAITSRELANASDAASKLAADTARRVLPLELDVADEERVKAAVDACLAEYGRIDILVNNAGNVVSTPQTAQIEDRPYADWLHTLNVNLNGTFLCSKYVTAKAMIPAKKGNIINIGSIAGIVGRDRRVYDGTDMGGSTVDYEAAKGGVIAMTRDMAVYLARYNIRVNCISPGGFFRNQPENFVAAYCESTPMRRMGIDGKEMKGPVVFLASEASSYCTGHNLVIDGGFTVW